MGNRKKEEYLFSGPGVSPDGHVAESTGFVRATTDRVFKIMLSDDRVAEALISDSFRDIKIMDRPTKIKIIGKGETKISLRGKRSNAVVDYHAIINNRDRAIIEMQILRHNNFDKRVLFHAASTFANQEFEGGSEWHSQIKNIYAIQFLDYSTLGNGNFRKYYWVRDKYSGRDLEGIFLIQNELKFSGLNSGDR
ncbi:MAG: Rpn family recombination-promoting nuclease/putative transposase [Puniceicoccales bacterium]|nr:Rpn family recombination-promoting nuclease/putative transposase [Puniceicoccales bacterium]